MAFGFGQVGGEYQNVWRRLGSVRIEEEVIRDQEHHGAATALVGEEAVEKYKTTG